MKKILFPVVLLFFVSCTRSVYVPQTERHVEFRDRVKLDSVVLRDSVFVFLRQDTIYIHRDRWRESVRIRHDTVFVHDSIPYPVEVGRQTVPKIYHWSLWIAIAAVVVVIKKLVF